MVLKRRVREGGDEGSEFPNRFKSPNPFAKYANKDFVAELVSKLEPSLRSWVSQEVERGLNSHMRSSHNQIDSCPSSRILQLHFDDKLPSTLFTGCRVETEGGEMVKVVLRDARSRKVVKSGPLSSAKVYLRVLDGDFNKDGLEDWSRQEFDNGTVQQREGKRPLVTGMLVLTLKEGVGYVEDISFTDNSSWTRSGKFRLGATSEGSIREGISNVFKVKDHRGEAYKKHDRPSWNDEVWRLKKIAKNGASHGRLTFHGIYNVKDFLRLYVTDPTCLRKILGSKISDKAWCTIIGHANACPLDENELYEYKAAEGTLVLNSIYEVDGVIFDDQQYLSFNMLNLSQKLIVESLKKIVYKNLKYLVPISDNSFVARQILLQSLQTSYFSNPTLGYVAPHPQNVNFPVEQDQMDLFNSDNVQLPAANAFGVGGSQYKVCEAETSHQMEPLDYILSNHLPSSDSYDELPSDGCVWDTPTSLGPLSGLTDQFVVNENFQVQISPWQGNSFNVNPRNPAAGIVSSDIGIRISGNGKPKAGWCIIRAVIKWRMIKSRCKKYGKSSKYTF